MKASDKSAAGNATDAYTNQDFWNWFLKHEKDFFQILKHHRNVETDFINKVSPELARLKEGYYILAGMRDEHTAELIITAEGEVKNFVFAEELIAQAPEIDGWTFTALKPPMPSDDFAIKMGKYVFDNRNIFFFPVNDPAYPDEIYLLMTHSDLNDKNRNIISKGIFVYVDNYLGEYRLAASADNIQIVPQNEIRDGWIPIDKLSDYLTWREKEFVEKYEHLRHDSSDDQFMVAEAELENGHMILAVMNQPLLQWDGKASHPWIAKMIIGYDGSESGGMPLTDDYEMLNQIEDEILESLIDSEGYLNFGRQTGENQREIYFACSDFRLPSKVFYKVQKKYEGLYDIEYYIYKDKYWKSFDRFQSHY